MYFYTITFISFVIDWTSKRFMEFFLGDKNINLIWDFLNLHISKNPWIAFSLPIEWLILKILTFIIISSIIYYYFKYEKSKWNIIQIAYWLIIWWAIWNWLERLIYSSVIDFISLKYFAIFNFADIFINIWVIILIFSYIKNEHRRK
ncbi:MAG: hypothetical protein ACD_4C00459G0008 [uncultured bacterium (gcode 4)]|uniref:Lipoprotein signal peptidase n=1 Tax=uncultured bacterium (gcode 4) TaxID=1234023 RepID=K2G7J2_9BACT|nr:MAG: hypothetical protein ACD_4C00459G0008 [uncultured bacterium (gcode 4)]